MDSYRVPRSEQGAKMDGVIQARFSMLEQIGVPADLARDFAEESQNWGHFRFAKALVALEQRMILEFSQHPNAVAMREELAKELSIEPQEVR